MRRYGISVIKSRRLFSLTACEFRDSSPIFVPGRPSYGLVPNSTGKPSLYCVRDIDRSEIITRNPVQVVPIRQVPALRVVGLEDLCFDWENGKYAVALGAGAFIEHSEEPNCYWTADYSNRIVIIRPRRSIFCGEKLTIDFSTDMRRPCTELSQYEVNRLPAKLLPRPKVPRAVVINDETFGRTLIAVRNIRRGTKVAESPARVIPNRLTNEYVKVERLTDLTHSWLRRHSALALGIPAFVNHSCAANAFYIANRRWHTISLIACKDIEAGHEVTMNYNMNLEDYFERETPLIVPLIRNIAQHRRLLAAS